MIPPLLPNPDRHARLALLAVRCIDAVDARVVQDADLQVEAIDARLPPASRRSRRHLQAGGSGLYGLHALDGVPTLRDRDAPDAIPELQTSPAAGPLQLLVRDRAGRYVDTLIRPDLPADGVQPVRLYSAASRPVPPPLGSLQVELRRRSRPDLPACWCWLTLQLGTRLLAEGVADRDGRAQLLFALPRPREGLPHGSPVTAGLLLDWNVTLHAHWAPWLQADDVPDQALLPGLPELPLLVQLDPPLALAPLHLRAGEVLLARRRPSSFVFVAD